MSRHRILAAAISVIALVLTAGVLSAPAQARAAKLPAKPKVGQCRTTTYAQTGFTTDSNKPVPCSKPHTMKTFAVSTIPKNVNLKKVNATQLLNAAAKLCNAHFNKAVGGSFVKLEQTTYNWTYFIPTKAARAKGQRWMRCDVALFSITSSGNGHWEPLPNLAFPLIGNRAITDATRRCLYSNAGDYVTTCSRPHVARSDQTFTLSSKGFPTKATFDSQAASRCPGKRYTTPGKLRWAGGDHVVVCYTATTS